MAKLHIGYLRTSTTEPVFSEDLNILTTYADRFLVWFSYYSARLVVDEENTEYGIDPRILIISYYKDAPNDTLYLGEHCGTVKNGTLMKDDADLLNLVKRKIGWGGTTVPLAMDSVPFPITGDSIVRDMNH